MLVHVNNVKFSSESETWKMIIEPIKHYVGIKQAAEQILVFLKRLVTCINIAKQQQHKIKKLVQIEPEFNVNFLKD